MQLRLLGARPSTPHGILGRAPQTGFALAAQQAGACRAVGEPTITRYSHRLLATALLGGTLLVAAARAEEAAWLAQRTVVPAGHDVLVLASGSERRADETIGPSVFSRFDLRVGDEARTGGVAERLTERFPHVDVRGRYAISAFTSATGSAGLVGVGPRGVEVLVSADDAFFLPERRGSALSVGGRFLGVITIGPPAPPEAGEGEDDAPAGLGALVVLDLRGDAGPAAHHVSLPPTIESLDASSLSLTENAVFVAARRDDGDWVALRARLDDLVLEEVTRPFDVLEPEFAVAGHAVAFFAGDGRNEVDAWVVRETGPAINATNDPQRYTRHAYDAPRLAVSDDGTRLAYNLEMDREPEVFVVEVEGPAVPLHITRDERFNPYIDQEALILFSPQSDLIFAAGHDPDATDVFVTQPSGRSINLTQTGSTFEAPFLRTGTLLVTDGLTLGDDRILVTATGFGGFVGTSLVVYTTAGDVIDSIGGIATTGGRALLERSIVQGIFEAPSQYEIVAARYAGFERIAVGTSPATLLAHDAADSFWYVPGRGIVVVSATTPTRWLVEDPTLAVHSARLSGDGALLAIVGSPSSLVVISTTTGAIGPPLASLDAGEIVAPGSAAPVVDPEPVFTRGDANGDRLFDLSDPITILVHLFAGSGLTPPCLDAADTDDDGAIRLTDAIRALDLLFRSGAPLPAPFPGPGIDPTGDDLGCAVSAGN